MFEAQYLFASDNAEGATVYSPWYPRQGDNARFNIELVAVNKAKLTVKIRTKNSEDGGDGDALVTPIVNLQNTIGRHTAEVVGGLKEMVRYEFTAIGDTPLKTEYVMLRVLSISWFDSLKA